MLLFPNCKINLGLNITGKRPDGYHNLQSVFVPVPLQDALEVVPAPGATAAITFTGTGLPIAGDEAQNLCVKAYHLLKVAFPQLPPAAMHLHKAIPMGAGLGGGSADGAFTLQLLNTRFKLGLTEGQLIDYALQLGSDCPFFIINRPCYTEGRGEVLTPINLPLGGYTIVLVNPGIHVPTGWAFSQLTPASPANPVQQAVLQPVEEWKHLITNDFEAPVIKAHPQLQHIKTALYSLGAVYASMSGSGSSFYGLFATPPAIAPGLFPEHYFVKQLILG